MTTDQQKTVAKLHFQRFEFKYVLNIAQYEAISKRLEKYMELDPYVASTKENAYEVISLYYDSPRFYAYWEKIDGARKRKKMRLRTYRRDGVLSDYCFFEIKRKFDAVVLKDRAMLTCPQYEELINTGSAVGFMDGSTKIEASVLEEFEYERRFRVLQPKELIVYKRKPFSGKFNNQVRVTFDYNIRARAADELFGAYDTALFTDVSGGKVIMELKFNGTLPRYVADVIKEYSLGRVPYSKYSEGLEATYSLPMLQALGNHSQSDSLRLKDESLF